MAATNCVACVSVEQLNAFILSTLVAAIAKAEVKSENLLISRNPSLLYPPYLALLFVQQFEKVLKNICWFEK